MSIAVAELDRPETKPSPLWRAPVALDHVSSDLGGRRVLDDVSLALEPGAITVLIGPSGVGKTVTVKHLVGLMRPTVGRVLSYGRDIHALPRAEWRSYCDRMSVMLQGETHHGFGLFGSLSAFDNVAYPLRVRFELSEDEVAQRTWELLGRLGLSRRHAAIPEQLSHGELRRVALARVLASRSELVVIDDLESGVDHVRLRGMIDLIVESQRELSSTVLVATNQPMIARRLADELVVLRAGRIAEQGDAVELLQRPDGFGRRLMEGDTSCGLSILDEVVCGQPARLAA
jgi:phospholipid/cholesterol/gamma-HCH transport system ATP-binding protein